MTEPAPAPENPGESPPENSVESPPENSAASSADTGNPLREQVVDVLKTCYDPEIPVDVYELGLVYRVEVDDAGKVEVDMTLTSPACPVAGTLPPEIEQKIGRVEGISSVRVDVVWDPPWNPDRMTDAAKLRLGLL